MSFCLVRNSFFQSLFVGLYFSVCTSTLYAETERERLARYINAIENIYFGERLEYTGSLAVVFPESGGGENELVARHTSSALHYLLTRHPEYRQQVAESKQRAEKYTQDLILQIRAENPEYDSLITFADELRSDFEAIVARQSENRPKKFSEMEAKMIAWTKLTALEKEIYADSADIDNERVRSRFHDLVEYYQQEENPMKPRDPEILKELHIWKEKATKIHENQVQIWRKLLLKQYTHPLVTQAIVTLDKTKYDLRSPEAQARLANILGSTGLAQRTGSTLKLGRFLLKTPVAAHWEEPYDIGEQLGGLFSNDLFRLAVDYPISSLDPHILDWRLKGLILDSGRISLDGMKQGVLDTVLTKQNLDEFLRAVNYYFQTFAKSIDPLSDTLGFFPAQYGDGEKSVARLHLYLTLGREGGLAAWSERENAARLAKKPRVFGAVELDDFLSLAYRYLRDKINFAPELPKRWSEASNTPESIPEPYFQMEGRLHPQANKFFSYPFASEELESGSSEFKMPKFIKKNGIKLRSLRLIAASGTYLPIPCPFDYAPSSVSLTTANGVVLDHGQDFTVHRLNSEVGYFAKLSNTYLDQSLRIEAALTYTGHPFWTTEAFVGIAKNDPDRWSAYTEDLKLHGYDAIVRTLTDLPFHILGFAEIIKSQSSYTFELEREPNDGEKTTPAEKYAHFVVNGHIRGQCDAVNGFFDDSYNFVRAPDAPIARPLAGFLMKNDALMSPMHQITGFFHEAKLIYKIDVTPPEDGYSRIKYFRDYDDVEESKPLMDIDEVFPHAETVVEDPLIVMQNKLIVTLEKFNKFERQRFFSDRTLPIPAVLQVIEAMREFEKTRNPQVLVDFLQRVRFGPDLARNSASGTLNLVVKFAEDYKNFLMEQTAVKNPDPQMKIYRYYGLNTLIIQMFERIWSRALHEAITLEKTEPPQTRTHRCSGTFS